MEVRSRRRLILAELNYDAQRIERTEHIRRLMALCIVGLLGVFAVIMAEAQSALFDATARYQASRSTMASDLDQAYAAGYIEADLKPVLIRVSEVEALGEPVWIGDRPAFYESQATAITELRTELKTLEAQVIDAARAVVTDDIDSVKDKVQKARVLGLEAADTAPIESDLAAVVAAAGAAVKIADVRIVATRSAALRVTASDMIATQEAEYSAIAQAAAELKAQSGNNPAGIIKSGQDALAAGRNDATVAAFLKLNSIDAKYRTLEHFGELMGSSDSDQAFVGIAGTMRAAGQLHETMVVSLPRKVVVVSIWHQQLWAYQDGRMLLDSLVTTGTPWDLPTPPGRFQILSKHSPFVFKSAWPEGDSHWFSDLPSAYVAFFTGEGHAIHDASYWRHVYGPGTQNNGSHGCVNMPYDASRQVFYMLEIGTPVVVIPGDGGNVSHQLSLRRDGDPALAGA
jgi:lipoprotein-anchoring transpeptidase ErfK/SrfK